MPALVALLLLTGCGGSDDPVAVDPGSSPSASGVPAAPGPVRTRQLATVMDTGTPELCLGPVAESWPPQCSGPALVGWDWGEHQGTYDRSGSARWGTYLVQGEWDGSTFTVESAVPGALYDPAPAPTPPLPEPAEHHSPAELEQVAGEVGEQVPGVLGAQVVGAHVLADVTYDDGTLQQQVDDEYGAGVVVLTSMIVDVRE